MGKTADLEGSRAVRWSLWLLTGMVCGLVVGFAFALTRPRVSRPGAHEAPVENRPEEPARPAEENRTS
ncbi:MAG: hypothetical protein ABWX96_04570 [Propionibacteriaceae bacterium]